MRNFIAGGAMLAAAVLADPAKAQTEIQVGCTATLDCASAMVIVYFYAASHDWAEKNPEAINNFRAGVVEAAAIVSGNRNKLMLK
jgi:hypothetical protein